MKKRVFWSFFIITLFILFFQSASATQEILFEDSFNDGGWTTLNGDWQIYSDGVNNQYVQFSGTTPDAYAFNGSTSWTNYMFKVKALKISGNSTGIIFRATDSTHYYEVRFSCGSEKFYYQGIPTPYYAIYLIKRNGGEESVLNVSYFKCKDKTYYNFRIIAYGNNIKVYVNNKLRINHYDSSYSNGEIGFTTHYANASFDEVNVTSDPPLPPEIVWHQNDYNLKNFTANQSVNNTCFNLWDVIRGASDIPEGPKNLPNMTDWDIEVKRSDLDDKSNWDIDYDSGWACRDDIGPVDYIFTAKIDPKVNVEVDYGDLLGINNMSLAVHDGSPHVLWVNDSLLNEKVRKLNLKRIRVEFHTYIDKTCIGGWNVTTKHCNEYNWTVYDSEVNNITKNFPEVAIEISHIGWMTGTGIIGYIPYGMPINDSFPMPEDYSSWFVDIVNHTVFDLGIYPVYFEVMNEPVVNNKTRALEYLNLYDKTREKVEQFLQGTGKELGKDVLLGINHIDWNTYNEVGDMEPFFDLVLDHEVEWASVHHYSAYGTYVFPADPTNVDNIFYPPNDEHGWLTDEKIIQKLDSQTLVPMNGYPTWNDMSSKYKQKWGKNLPLMNTEINLNAWWRNGTDPRHHLIFNAVHHAINLKNYAMGGLIYYTFFNLGSGGRGSGFGILNATQAARGWYCINSKKYWDPDQDGDCTDNPEGGNPLYYDPTFNVYLPYWMAYLWGNYIPNGSTFYNFTTSDSDIIDVFPIRTQDSNNILLINKMNTSTNVTLPMLGFALDKANLIVLDDDSFAANPEGGLRVTPLPKNNVQNIILNGYSVALIQANESTNEPYIKSIPKSLSLLSSYYDQSNKKFYTKSDCTGSNTIEYYVPEKPLRITKDGIDIPEDPTLSTTPSWKYENKLVTVKFSCE